MQYAQFNPLVGVTDTEHGNHTHQTSLAVLLTGGKSKAQVLQFKVTKGNAMMRYIDAITAALIQQASMLGIRVDATQTRQYVASRFQVKGEGTVATEGETPIQPIRTIHLLTSEATRFTHREVKLLAQKADKTIKPEVQAKLDATTKAQIEQAFPEKDIKQPVLLPLSTLADKSIQSWGVDLSERTLAFGDQPGFRQVSTEDRLPAGVG